MSESVLIGHAVSAGSSASNMYDLTPVMAPYFDVHMVNPLLDHLRESNIYPSKHTAKEKIRIAEKTNMLDVLEEEYESLPDDPEMQKEYANIKPNLEERKSKIFDQMDNEPVEVKKLDAFFSETAVVAELKTNSNLNVDFLSTNHGITAEMLEIYYKFSKFKYECGMYTDAETMLGHYLSVIQPHSASHLGALWGRLACRIVQARWSESLEDLHAVKEAIEVRSISPIDQLRQRAWLMHWGLFVYMNRGAEGVEKLAFLFSEKHYLQTLENLCPWLLRYYSAAVILNPSRRRSRSVLKDLLAEIAAMSYQYSDPITLFLGSLFENFDFDSAQKKLEECEKLVENDFFLHIHRSQFMHEARMLICEMYCAIHSKVDLSMLAEKLKLTDEETERWMVDMVRGTSGGPTLDAKIDSAGRQVIIAAPTRSAYKQIVESVRDLTTRSAILSGNLENLVTEQAVYMQNRSLFIPSAAAPSNSNTNTHSATAGGK